MSSLVGLIFNKKYHRGFTLVELLVTISIIALLAVGVILSFQHQRAKARDALRLANLNQFKTALALYHSEVGLYPIGSSMHLGSAPEGQTIYTCLSGEGFKISCNADDKIFMVAVPGDPTSGQYFIYQSFIDNSGYAIDFTMEVGTDVVGKDENCLTIDGIMPGFCNL